MTAIVLTFFESDYEIVDLLFETVSAIGTVGFSTGITADLSVPSQIVLTIAMFVGRVGPPIAIVTALSRPDREGMYRYTKERVLLG